MMGAGVVVVSGGSVQVTNNQILNACVLGTKFRPRNLNACAMLSVSKLFSYNMHISFHQISHYW